jgi:hypothetical protein
MCLSQLNPVEPPWYGPVCPVVGEGWHREVSPYPDHIGNPEAIGISDLGRPDYGEPVEIRPGEVPVFWACGVTPQAVALEACPELMITHEPGIMFLTDLPREGETASRDGSELASRLI